MSNPTDHAVRDMINAELGRETPALRLATQDESGWYASILIDGEECVRRGLWVTTRDGEGTKAGFYRGTL